jgi:hypothetical protein
MKLKSKYDTQGRINNPELINIKQPKTDAEIQQQCDECDLGKWAWGPCRGKNCTGNGVIEDTYDGLCRWCVMDEERPTDPALMPPPMREGSSEVWREYLHRVLSANPMTGEDVERMLEIVQENELQRKWVN